MKHYIGVPIKWHDLLALARYHRKMDIVERMEKADQADYDLFLSDGCSMWPDEWKSCAVDLSGPCFWHDVAYFLGGTMEQRLAADRQLYADVFCAAGIVMAQTMFTGVRAGGWLPGTGFHWGYGRLHLSAPQPHPAKNAYR